MAKKLRVVLAQLNLCVGDIQGNLTKSITAAHTARDELGADVIVFPELSLTGYPPEDLLYRQAFLTEVNAALEKFQAEVKNIYCLVGHPHPNSHGLHNACSLIYNGTILTRYNKISLPNYGIFDEARYFTPGNLPCVIPINGVPVGIIICEDLWTSSAVQQTANQGARLILDMNASPFETGKHEQRHMMLSKRAKAANVPIAYVNCVGQQDEILFDGGSMAVDHNGKICQFGGFYQENLLPIDVEVSTAETKITPAIISIPSEDQRVYDGLVFGVRDYLTKNNFTGALIGVSGGIDSALTLAIATDAIGNENVEAILLPSRHTAQISTEDAIALVNNLGVKHQTISIEPSYKAFLESLAPAFHDQQINFTEENIQARCRGVILMALSNKSGKILLSTSNRSEMAVGYSTLYGDMCGGLAVLKDVSKTMVYQLAAYRNQLHSPVIPQRTLDRAPTAELAPNQKDEDLLPPYPLLDKILDLYLNQDQSVADIIAQGFEEETVEKIIRLINKSEYKRRQAAIGIRINKKAFGRDRRYPITSKFKG